MLGSRYLRWFDLLSIHTPPAPLVSASFITHMLGRVEEDWAVGWWEVEYIEVMKVVTEVEVRQSSVSITPQRPPRFITEGIRRARANFESRIVWLGRWL